MGSCFRRPCEIGSRRCMQERILCCTQATMPSFLASTDTGGAGGTIHVRRSSWYFTWIVLLPCFHPGAACLLLTVLEFLSYKIFINYRAYSDWHFDPFFQW